MNISQPVKRFRMENAFNVRDMGGYETADGKVTSFGKLLRSDGLHKLSDSEWEGLKSLGVRTVIDLRSHAEIEANRDRVPDGISRIHCPLQTEQIHPEDVAGSALVAFTESLTQGYLNIVRNNGKLLASALRELIHGLERGAVLFHCSAGKDRTGVLASAVYYLTGVEREDIIADYEVTYTYNKRGINRMLELAGEDTRKRMTPYMTSQPENMDCLLSLYEEIDLAAYLRGYGITKADLDTLKKCFLVQ